MSNRTPHIYLAHTKIHTKRYKKSINSLKNQKSHGSDGIPGEAYKILHKHINLPIANIMNHIQAGGEMPKEWVEGTIVHIYKNKGEIDDCAPYRPICLTQIIYKIWPQLLTTRLAKILHTITSQQQF